MKGWLEYLPESGALSTLDKLACDEWLWVDATGEGVHLADARPSRLEQITHLWGWGDGISVRVRVDSSLPADGGYGVAGSILRWGSTPPVGADEVGITATRSTPWPVGNGRANMAPVAGLNAGATAPIRSLTVPIRRNTTNGDELFVVSFLGR